MKTKLKTALSLSLVLLAGASNLFALSSKARMVLTGNLLEETKNDGEDAEYKLFTLNDKAQKDDDGIVIDFSAGNFGGRLGLWYKVDGSTAEGSAVSFRRSNVWFKPLENLKLTLGYVGTDQLYKEKIDEWKVGNPFKFDTRDWSAHPGYVNNSDVDEMGFGFETRPMDGLIVTGGISRRWGNPGDYGKPFWSKADDDAKWDAWGLTARYYYGNFCFQGAYRDNGKEQWKVARCAVGYEANGFYGFVQPCVGIDWDSADKKYEATGVCFDLYGEYKIDALALYAHVPVTVRITDENNSVDPSYLEYVLMAKYNFGKIGNMDDFSTYLKFGSMNHDGDNEFAYYRFNDQFSDSVNFDITPGISFSVGACEIDLGVEVLVHSKLYVDSNNSADVEFKIPFSAEIRF